MALEAVGLEGKRAVVTGGASGIGLATCRRLVAAGAKIAILDIDAERADKAAAELQSIARPVDVRDAEALQAAIDEAANSMGGLDVLVNNAGAGDLRPLHESRPKDWERLIGVNLTGTWNGIRAVVPRMLERGGVIVNNASLSGLRPTRGEAPYSAAKAGVIALTRSAALEYGPAIRVNCVAPGIIRTPMTEMLFRLPDALEPARRATPLRRMGTAEEVADVIYFLCSDLSRYVTGQTLTVDGGLGLPQAGIDSTLGSLLDRSSRSDREPEDS